MALKHKSVLVNDVIKYLDPKPSKVYVDVTFGCGGHTRAILDHEPKCKVIGIDWDLDSLKENESILKSEYDEQSINNRLSILWGNFANIYKILKKAKIDSVDGFLADFGTSQLQINERPGLSFMKDTPLDMRISKSHYTITAADIVNNATEKELITILQDFGQETNARKIARAIVHFRKINPIKTTGQLIKILEPIVPLYRNGKKQIHPATKTFQALRIAVNNELDNIKIFMQSALALLNPGGRFVCISFHSLEDRIVKNFFKDHTDKLQILTPKPITASDEELAINASSRSAKLRAAEKF